MYIQLKHISTGLFLCSKYETYREGSKQSQVVTRPNDNNKDLWWKVTIKKKNAYRDNSVPDAVMHKEIIILTNAFTTKNLHSHKGIKSPVTKQQELTGFGGVGIGDTNDDWEL